ncbi:MAG: response regulator [Armatimonadetes bacterium]|nr:response regulator [Armatimonadota bacterium]
MAATLPPVLIVEDEPDARMMLAEVLEVSGYPVLEAGTCRAALERMEEQPVALAIIDLRLPDGDGLDLMRELKEINPDLVPIITTGNATLQTAVEALNQGVYAYLLKPYEPQALLNTLRQAAEKWSLKQENAQLLRQTRAEKDRVTALLQASEEINAASTDVQSVTRSIVQTAVRIMAARAGFIALVEGESLDLREWWDGERWHPLELHLKEGEGGPGYVWMTRETHTSGDARKDPHLLPELSMKLEQRTMICCPIQTRYGEFLGVLDLSDKNRGEPFTPEDARFLEGLCRHVAVVLENARLNEEKRKSEEQRKQFYRDVICAATQNKLLLCDRYEMEAPFREPDLLLQVESAEDLSKVRNALARTMGDVLEEERLCGLQLCVGEAATNAYKHGGGGDVLVWIEEGRIQIRVEDRGPGIDATTLPKATLMAGYSTKTSLGMGLTIILDFVEQLVLATDADGTMMDMYIPMKAQEKDPLELLGLAAYL